MTGRGTVAGVFVAPAFEAEMREQSTVEVVADGGLRGDRYYRDPESADEDDEGVRHDLTLIEREAIAAVEREAGITLAPGEHRRNVETRDVALNHLVGRRFRVGEVGCRGEMLCEPCAHLQELTHEGVLNALVHRGGLRADVLEGGVIRPGDVVEPLD